MGKPFKKELQCIYETIEWAAEVDISLLKKEIIECKNDPLIIIGSGGSLSACFFALKLHQQKGQIAKAATPLELFYSKNILKKCSVLFLSSSGKNTDVLTAFKNAILEKPKRTFGITLAENTPLSILSGKSKLATIYEFTNPVGKDGFLATNSLIAFFIILSRAYGYNLNSYGLLGVSKNYHDNLQIFGSKINKDFTFKILYADWSMPVAFDIESKFSEAALGNVLLSDYRNFGHGRHHWLDKRGTNTAVVALITPSDKELAEKTLALLPPEIVVFKIETDLKDSLSSIDLLIKSFYFADLMGDLQGIDPGRPGVPSFGSKLYNLNYSKLLPREKDDMKMYIQRKLGMESYYNLKDDSLILWQHGLENYIKKLNSSKFKAIVFDYDGTLCSTINRYAGLDDVMGTVLNNLLDNNIVVGVATGRGKSIKKDLRRVIKKEYWDKVIIGYYNGSDIGFLNNDNLPDNSIINPILLNLRDNLLLKFGDVVDLKLKNKQLTIEFKGDFFPNDKSLILQYIQTSDISGILCVESGHSIDVIVRPDVSKLNVLRFIEEYIKDDYKILSIGDKGKFPGNDFELLSHKFSLSVDEASSDKDSCWNLAPSDLTSAEATLYYLKKIKLFNNYFKLKL